MLAPSRRGRRAHDSFQCTFLWRPGGADRAASSNACSAERTVMTPSSRRRMAGAPRWWMKGRNVMWVEQVDLGASEVVRESRHHLDLLRVQLRATSHAIDSARWCIDESWELLANLNTVKAPPHLD